MAFSIVASASKDNTDNNSVTTTGIDTSGADTIFIGLISSNSVATPTVSDSKSNTWTKLTEVDSGASGAGKVAIYYAKNATVGASHTFSSSAVFSSFPNIVAMAVSGGNTTAPFDAENNSGSVSAATVQTGSVTPSQDNEILVTIFGDRVAGVPTIDSSFTVRETLAYNPGVNVLGLSIAYKIQTTAGAENPTWDTGGFGFAQSANIACFKAAAPIVVPPIGNSYRQRRAA